MSTKSKIDRYLRSTMAIAGASMAVGAVPASAAIFSDLTDVVITAGAYTLLFETGLDTGTPTASSFGPVPGTGTAVFTTYPGYEFQIYNSTGFGGTTIDSPVLTEFYTVDLGGNPAVLPVGYVIDGGLTGGSGYTWTGSFGDLSTNWFPSSTGYVGFKMNYGGSFYYGWIGLTTGATAGDAITVSGWAWESSAGTGITAGAVPEPSSLATLGLLAAGAAGMRRWRRRDEEEAA